MIAKRRVDLERRREKNVMPNASEALSFLDLLLSLNSTDQIGSEGSVDDGLKASLTDSELREQVDTFMSAVSCGILNIDLR